MSQGEPSRSPYIIICNGDTKLLTTNDPMERIRIASQTATDMVMYLGIVANGKLKIADTKPISDCLHKMEAVLKLGGDRRLIPDLVTELMAITEGLHKKFARY